MGTRFNNFKQNVKIQAVKKHFEEHKEAYIAGGCGLALGSLAMFLGRPGVNKLELGGVVNNNTVSPEITVSPQFIDIHIEALGDPGNIIQDQTTGIVYASQNQAAKELGVNRARISEHLAGDIESVAGHKLVKLGKAHVSAA